MVDQHVVAVGNFLDSNPVNTAVSTYHGNIWDIRDESTWVFDPRDIATSLSNLCRFGGHVDFYSVGEHSLHVKEYVASRGYGPKVQKAALLHDASEAYLLDIPRPWKSLIRIGDETYYQVEDRLQDSIMAQFDVLDEWREHHGGIIKEADMALYREEADHRPGCNSIGSSPRVIATIFLATLNGLAG